MENNGLQTYVKSNTQVKCNSSFIASVVLVKTPNRASIH